MLADNRTAVYGRLALVASSTIRNGLAMIAGATKHNTHNRKRNSRAILLWAGNVLAIKSNHNSTRTGAPTICTIKPFNYVIYMLHGRAVLRNDYTRTCTLSRVYKVARRRVHTHYIVTPHAIHMCRHAHGVYAQS